MPAPADRPVSIPLSNEERDTGVLTPLHLFDAIDALFRDGLVVLHNAVELGVVDRLNERMKEDTERILSGEVKAYWNQGIERGNVSQVPPLEEDYLFPQIYANKPAGSILTQVLGPNPELRYIRSNTLIGNTPTRQRVHKDATHIHLSHPYGVALNTCLIDVTPDNGSTEVWLGTNNSSPPEDAETVGHPWIREEKLEERRKVRPPVQPVIPKGSVILRDLRLWHAGMPNHTPDTRVMLALVYFAPWYKNQMNQPVPRSLQPTINKLQETNRTTFGVKYVEDDEADYLATEFVADFSSPLQKVLGN